MAKIDKFSLTYTQNGMIRSAAIDDVLVPENTCQLSLNLHFDRIGAVCLRPGLTPITVLPEAEVGSLTNTRPIQGIANYRNNAGTVHSLVAKINTKVYALNGVTWTEARTGLTENSQARFTNLVDYLFMVNGHGNEVCQTYNGTVFGNTNVASLPKGDYIENFRSRIWIADDSTDKVYYSDVVTTSGNITGGTSFIQVSPQDGEKITGLKRHPRALLVFKQNHIYRIFSINSADPDPSITKGTYSQESIIESKSGLFYHHSTGFYRFNFDGEQEEISRPIIDIVRAIPRTAYEKVVGWCDDDHLYWSVGDVTLEGVTYSNLVCRYTLSTQIWTVYSYGVKITAACDFDNGTTIIPVVGTDSLVAGKRKPLLQEFNKGFETTEFDFETHWLYLTKSKTTLKTLTEIAAIHEQAEGAKVAYQIDSSKEWKPIKSIEKDLYDVMKMNALNFSRIRFRVFGSAEGEFIFRTLEILGLSTN